MGFRYETRTVEKECSIVICDECGKDLGDWDDEATKEQWSTRWDVIRDL